MSREDISTTSERNIQLRNGLATTFIKVIRQFCEHPELCYSWPVFLPSVNDRNSSPFWAELVERLKKLVTKAPILKSRHLGDFRTITEVYIARDDAKDEMGEPLFDDPVVDPYISARYSTTSLAALNSYGLQYMHDNLFLDLLEADLKSSSSRMKSITTSEEWHAAAAKALCRLLARGPERSAAARLKGLCVIPLQNGKWVAANKGPAWFPDTNGIPIPPALDLQVLDAKAAACRDRRSLFSLLGVSEASVAEVRRSILSAYSHRLPAPCVSPTESRSHLQFLYLTHQPDRAAHGLRPIQLISRSQESLDPLAVDLYLPSEDPYGPGVLLAPSDTAPGLTVNFIHPTYLENEPQPPVATHPSWRTWLRDSLGIRERLRLVSRQGDSLSEEFQYVAKYSPGRLLGLLRNLWPYEGSLVQSNSALKGAIRKIGAKHLCGQEQPPNRTLEGTWLPLPRLQQMCSRFMEGHEYESFPFLKLEEHASSEDDIKTNWMFLHEHFSVRTDDSVRLLLQILVHIWAANQDASTLNRVHRLFDLYSEIELMCLESEDVAKTRALVKYAFGH